MRVSIVIPTYNRPKALEDCLQALQEQSFDEIWEVIVVDDGGNVSLKKVIASFTDNINLTFLRQANSGPASARNNGARIAKGEYIAFLDDDCEPEIDWLQQLLKYAGQGVMVGGKTINRLKNNLYSETSQLLVSFLYQEFKETPWYFFTSNNFLVDRKTFIEMDGFDESFSSSAGEDREFCLRWRHTGHKMHYHAKAVIRHAHHQTLSSFWKMHLKYGRAAFFFGRKVKQLRSKGLKPRISFYISLFGFVQRYKRPNFKRRAFASILILLSQVATLFGFWREKLKAST